MANEDNDPVVFGALPRDRLKKSIEHLLGICDGLIADSYIAAVEVEFLSLWIKNHPEVIVSWPGKQIAARIKMILADGVITAEERYDLLELLTEICGTQFLDTGSSDAAVAGIPFEHQPSIIFAARTFCFTGRFVCGSRLRCVQMAEERGARVVDSVLNNLEYLVVGSIVEPSWIHTTYGRKIQKALELKERGLRISIISEDQWLTAVAQSPSCKKAE